MVKPILNISNLFFSFGDSGEVLSGINLTVGSGEIVGIIGPNGAGKSTLIRLITGLHHLRRGQIKIMDRAIGSYSKKELALQVGYVPQNVDISFAFSVEEVIAMGRYPHLQGLVQNDADGRAAIESALDWMDLQALRRRPFNELSGGEKQRTIIASVLAQQAGLLCLDEPTSALDLHHQQSINRILGRLAREEQKTIIVVTHDINLAAQFCSRLVLLDKGRLAADGRPDQVLQFSLIEQVYGVKVYIDINPFTKSLYILPYDTK